MKLNHVNLTVTDVSEARKFLEKYFGLQGSINPYSGESIEGSGDRGGFAVLFDEGQGGRHQVSTHLPYRLHATERREGERDQSTPQGRWVRREAASKIACLDVLCTRPGWVHGRGPLLTHTLSDGGIPGSPSRADKRLNQAPDCVKALFSDLLML
jgi:hypothetical protein